MATEAPGDTPGGGSEHDWLFDYIMNVFKAPTWEVPVMSFIDDNCVVFDNEEENKFAYSELHEKFKSLVEGLLEAHLTEIGVAPEDFVEICSQARYGRDVNRMVFDQIMAVDDFTTFKKLMQKRNMELELEAVKALKARSAAGSGAATATPAPGDDGASESDGDGDDGTGAADAGDPDYMDEALRASLADYEVSKTDAELEMAELEQAIAASLALEQERLRLLKAVAAAEAAAKAAAEELQTMTEAIEEISKEAEEATAPAEPPPSEGKDDPAPAASEAPAESKHTEAKAEEPAASDAAAAGSVSSPARSPATATKGADGTAPGTPVGDANAYLERTREAARRVEPSLTSTPLPDLVAATEQRKAAAQAAFDRAQTEKKKLAELEAKRMSEVASEDEMRRRAEHLRKQRDIIRARRQAKREKELRQHEREQKSVDETEKAKVAEAAKRAAEASRAGTWGASSRPGWGTKAATAGGAGAAPAPADDSAAAREAAANEKRMALRRALAQRMKEDVLSEQAARSATEKEAAFSTLDAQLSAAEAARARGQEEQARREAALRAAAAQRARNVMSSVKEL